MGQEIEKKFLLRNDDWRGLVEGKNYRQGYINFDKERTVRVRTIQERGFLTIKGPGHGAVRLEYEYDIPITDAEELLDKLCHKPLIEKIRYKIPYKGFTWEVDEFKGENKGLLFAEIELEYENQLFTTPSWIGEEVTRDRRYYNANLVENPYKNWRIK